MSKLINTSFTPEQLAFLSFALLFFLVSLFFYAKGRFSPAIAFLLIGGFILRYFMIGLDPFLGEWDERYHALVAKNMMADPFNPKLWPQDILPYDYKEWCCNYIWLHKQPLFMWQMALSMKLFGINEIAMRLPSALMNTIQIWLTYRIGRIAFDQKTGYIAALLSALAYYGLEQVSGSMGREHNDVAFYFYLMAAFWALAEYLQKPRTSFLLLIGVFAGMAILNKWLVGLLVFAGWGGGSILLQNKQQVWFHFKSISIALFVAAIVFLPWQIYTRIKYPLESAHEFAFNRMHITQTLDGHGGDWLYYFSNNYILYGKWSWIWMLAGLFIFIKNIQKNTTRGAERIRVLQYAIPVSLLVIYAFFTFVKTKFVSFVYISSFVFMLMSAFLVFFENILKKYLPRASGTMMAIVLMLASFYTLRHSKIEAHHANSRPNYFGYGPARINRIHNAQQFRALKQRIGSDYVIFNTLDAVEIMFYTDNIAYFWIGPEDYHRLKAAGIKMAAILDKDHRLPYYLEQDSSVVKLQLDLKR